MGIVGHGRLPSFSMFKTSFWLTFNILLSMSTPVTKPCFKPHTSKPKTDTGGRSESRKIKSKFGKWTWTCQSQKSGQERSELRKIIAKFRTFIWAPSRTFRNKKTRTPKTSKALIQNKLSHPQQLTQIRFPRLSDI